MQTGFGQLTGSPRAVSRPSSMLNVAIWSERSLAAYRVRPSLLKARCRGQSPPEPMVCTSSTDRPSAAVAKTATVLSPRFEP